MMSAILASAMCLALVRTPVALRRHSDLRALDTKGSDAPPVGLHLGVVCDETMNVISGYRYTRIGSSPSYDLCQAEFDKLPAEEQAGFERLAPPITPRRALLFGLGTAALASAIAAVPPPTRDAREQGLYYDDFIELPPLSPAEQIVAFFFKPVVPATQREASPRSTRRPLISPAAAAECDTACKQAIADRRALFEQSRTTNDRQKILDLSRQRAALYNTTFRGASCIPGIPCL